MSRDGIRLFRPSVTEAPAMRKATSVSDGSRTQTAGQGRRGGDPSRPVTIAYIAESAGVSIPTVSKVVNGRSGVSADTRARVEDLINRHGYVKPSVANRSNVVELVFRELESMWAVEIIRGVERVARQRGAGVMVSNFGLHDSTSRHPGTTRSDAAPTACCPWRSCPRPSAKS
jgi:Bacterial regulatory proteins, lacI family